MRRSGFRSLAASSVYRRGIAGVLGDAGMTVVASVEGQADLVAAPGPADVALVDVGLPGLMPFIGGRSGGPRVLLLVSSADDADVILGLRHRPDGLLSRDAAPEEFVAAVTAVAHRGVWVSPGLLDTVLGLATSAAVRRGVASSAGDRHRHLSPREREVLALVAAGHSNRGVAAQLFIAENTVKNHMRSILEKLGLGSRVEATLYAVSTGMVGSADSEEFTQS